MQDEDKYQVVNSRVDYTNPYMRIRTDTIILPNGEEKEYYVLEREDFSVVVPLTARKKTYLVGQYRHPIGRYSWEFPMGYVAQKSPLEMAQIELQQETGLTAKLWHKIGRAFIGSGHSSQACHIFIAEELQEGKQQLERHEFLTVRSEVELKEIAELITAGKIFDGPTIIAFHFLERYLVHRYNIVLQS